MDVLIEMNNKTKNKKSLTLIEYTLRNTSRILIRHFFNSYLWSIFLLTKLVKTLMKLCAEIDLYASKSNIKENRIIFFYFENMSLRLIIREVNVIGNILRTMSSIYNTRHLSLLGTMNDILANWLSCTICVVFC